MKKPYKARKDNNKAPMQLMVLTFVVWIIVDLLILWVFVAVGWWLLANIWPKGVFVPYSVSATVNSLKLIAFWIIIISFVSILNKSVNKNRLPSAVGYDTTDNNHESEDFEWIEIYFTANEGEYINLSEKLKESSPDKLLSYGVLLTNKKRYKEAISILRIVIDHPKASLLTKKIAGYRLMQLLPQTGRVGEHLSKRMEGEKQDEHDKV